MSNFPHSALLSSSLSTSPYALQSNLESLMNRSRSHPYASRSTDLAPGTDASGSNGALDRDDDTAHRRRRSSNVAAPRLDEIREASYRDGAALLIGDEEDDERSPLVSGPSSRPASRSHQTPKDRSRSYGAVTDSVGGLTIPGPQYLSPDGRSGSSRSRSRIRSPPRTVKTPHRKSSTETSSNSNNDIAENITPTPGRGRDNGSRLLSPVSSRAETGRTRRLSEVQRLGDDSSGDEGGDVARGLVRSGGGTMFGGKAGMGEAGAQMELDPADELDAEDLEIAMGQDGKEVRQWSEALRAELPLLVRSTLPVFLTQMAEWSLVLSSVISIGHLGTTDLAATTLASMTAAVSSFSILQGLATALDTLLPAAWTSSDPSRVGLWTQRMGIVIAVSMIPMFVFWWNIEGILLSLGQEPEVARLASQYLRWLSIGIPGYGGNVVTRKYLQAQNLMSIPTYVLFIVAPLNIVLNYLLVWGPQAIRLGFVGGALATATSYNLTFLLTAGYALFLGPREAFHPFHLKTAFSKLGTVTSLGLAGTIMLSSEWWAWEACALAASALGPISLAAQSVVLSTASTFYQVPASLGIASAVRCGNLLGAGRGWEAKWASRATLILSVMFASVSSLILLVFRKNWGYLFNSDPAVVEIVASIMPYIALFQVRQKQPLPHLADTKEIADGVAATTGSILRSLGRHSTGALINLTSYYIIGLPVGLWLCFQPKLGLGLVGLWIGLSIALGYASAISTWLVWTADWTRAVERVRERLGLPVIQGELGADGKWDEVAEETDSLRSRGD